MVKKSTLYNAETLMDQEEKLFLAHNPRWTLEKTPHACIKTIIECETTEHVLKLLTLVIQITQNECPKAIVKIVAKTITIEIPVSKIHASRAKDFKAAHIISSSIEKTKTRVNFDDITTLQHLKNSVKEFVSEREWAKFHCAKNLSMCIAIEAAELMEHFLWCDTSQADTIFENKKVEVQEECADILLGLLCLATRYDMDIASLFIRKLNLVKEKYPVEKAKGKSDKYTAYQKIDNKS